MDSAILLHRGFEAFDNWMDNNPCNSTTEAQRGSKFLKFIKSEFEEQGGNLTLTPPLGFLGVPSNYKYSFYGIWKLQLK